MQCKDCGKYFLITETETFGSSEIKNLAGSNITPALRRIATLCGASWPYEQAEKVISELTGVCVSHETIQNLCESEANLVEAEHQQNYEILENQALVETMESLVGYLAEEEDCYV